MVDMLMPPLPPPNIGLLVSSLDGDGAGDHDQPYRFGLRPRASATYPFNTRQYARLLMLRGRIWDVVGAAAELDSCDSPAIDLRPAA